MPSFAQSRRQTRISSLNIPNCMPPFEILALTLPQSCGIALAGSLTVVQFHCYVELTLNKTQYFAEASVTGKKWSGKRDLNPRLQPWQGCTLPLSYSRPVLQATNSHLLLLCQQEILSYPLPQHQITSIFSPYYALRSSQNFIKYLTPDHIVNTSAIQRTNVPTL
jgi:hypothetical protein